MVDKKLGCLTTGGLISIAVTATAILAVFITSGSLMFSPGGLNNQGSGALVGGFLTHAEIGRQCGYCHPTPWDRVDQSDLCLDCHQDIKTDLSDRKSLHGAVRTVQTVDDCRVCHTEHQGLVSDLTFYSGENFPHDLLAFSLQAHSQLNWVRDITCVDCHQGSFQDISDAACIDCHSDLDASTILAHQTNYGKECLACHDGLETINTLYDHSLTDFPLFGKHQILACSSCHAGLSSVKEFEEMLISCLSCHADQDVHQKYLGEICEECHTPAGWDSAEFNHTITGFILDGGHADLVCSDCHIDRTFQGQKGDCLTCHREDEPHQMIFGEDCAACHSTESWLVVQFDHAGPYSGFCSTCHQKETPENHFPGQCSICHQTTAWKPVSVPHTFPVNHEGANNQCNLCHPANVFSTYDCYQCHEHNRSEMVNKHEGISNLDNCIRCHWDGRKHDDD